MNPFLRLICVLAVVLAAGCRHTLPPEVADGLYEPLKVSAPLLEEEVGILSLQEDGEWVFVTERGGKAPPLEPHQLFVYSDPEDPRTRFLFVVIDTHEWGARLQRLDVDDISNIKAGAGIPVGSIDLASSGRWGFCVGFEQAPLESPCINNAAPGSTFNIYPLKNSRELVVQEGEDLLPAHRSALIWVGAKPVLFGDAKAAKGAVGWIAIPGKSTPRPSKPTLVMTEQCSDFDTPEIWRETGDPRPVTHPYAIESEAYRLMADAFAWCDSSGMTLGAAAFHRQPLDSDEPRLAISPLITMAPFDVPSDKVAQENLLQAVGFLATGDFVLADFFIERAQSRAFSQHIALRTMDLAVNAGRPEAAIRRGYAGTNKSWNRKGDPYWVFGMARVDHYVGDSGSFTARWKSVPDLANANTMPELTGWLIWHELNRKLRDDLPPNATSLNDLLDRADGPDFETWRLVYRAEAMRHKKGPQVLDAYRSEFEAAEAIALLEAYEGKGVSVKCDKQHCRLDAYGRRFTSWWNTGPKLDDSERAPRATWLPGYSDPGAAALEKGLGKLEALDRIRLAASFARLSDNPRHPVIYGVFARTAAELVAECRDGKRTAAQMAPALRAASASLVTVEGAVAVAERWLISDAISAACVGWSQLNAVTDRYEQDKSVQHPGIALYLAMLWRTKDADKRLRVLQDGALYASKYEKSNECRKWNLALALVAAEAARRGPAATFATRASQCGFADADANEAVIQAYLQYQRSLVVSLDFDRLVRERVQRAVRLSFPKDRCAGSAPLDFDLRSEIQNEVADLVSGIQLPHHTPKELEVVQATDFLFEANTALDAARKSFLEGQPDAAKSQLVDASKLFAKIGHVPGQSLTRFLLIPFDYERRPARWQAAFFKQDFAKAKKLGAPGEIQWVQLWLLKGDKEFRTTIDRLKPEDRPALLCNAPK